MPNPKIQLAQHIPTGADMFHLKACDSRTYYRVAGSPSERMLCAEQDGEGWLTRFAQQCYDRGREDERALRQVAEMERA